jgi:hypothetical protein
MISQWTRGEARPSTPNLLAIARVFSIRPQALFELAGVAPPPGLTDEALEARPEVVYVRLISSVDPAGQRAIGGPVVPWMPDRVMLNPAEQAFAVTVANADLSPIVEVGDIVIADAFASPSERGIVVVTDDHGRPLVYRFGRGAGGLWSVCDAAGAYLGQFDHSRYRGLVILIQRLGRDVRWPDLA